MEDIKRIMHLFRGLDRAHGVFYIDSKKGTKLTGKAITIAEAPTEQHWKNHIEGRRGLGIVPIMDSGFCHFGAIDIDINDIDHCELEKKIVDNKLPLIVCRSKSGGAHLYVFFSEVCEAPVVREKLSEWAAVLGYAKVEIFPKQDYLASNKDTGNWINLPYFDSIDTLRYGFRDGQSLTLHDFVHYAEEKSITPDAFTEIELVVDDEFADAPPCIRSLASIGVPDGTRNNALFSFGVFARKAFPELWGDKLDEYNTKYMSPPLGSGEVQGLVKSLNRKSYYYKCKDAPLVDFCNKAVCRTCKYGVGAESDDPGITVDELTMLDTEPPIWFINVNGKRIELTDTDDLLTQRRFAKLCVEKLQILPVTVKPHIWSKFIQSALKDVTVVQAPKDASASGLIASYLGDFCLGKAQAQSREEIVARKPWHNEEDGFIYFKSDHF